jgi:hypothetical protein
MGVVKCGCRVEKAAIQFCDLHRQAEELRDALRLLTEAVESDSGKRIAVARARAVLAKVPR